jgi:hypothetical protein
MLKHPFENQLHGSFFQMNFLFPAIYQDARCRKGLQEFYKVSLLFYQEMIEKNF